MNALQRLIPGLELVYDGFVRVWKGPDKHEIVSSTDSVAFLIHIVDRDLVVFVHQRRAPMVSDKNPTGELLETPAGRFDCALTAEELIAKEAGEEVGATVDPAKVILFNEGIPLAMCPGILTEKQFLGLVRIYSSEIENEERIFGVDADEQIRREFIPVTSLSLLPYDDLKTYALVQRFLHWLREDGRSI
ncbi:MAG: hypothetical protein KW788_02505 [Candidatus Doudnabacteria bacterium]|nr:hypothetical protein [Candidatus Doudnabacteria bacterium]